MTRRSRIATLAAIVWLLLGSQAYADLSLSGLLGGSPTYTPQQISTMGRIYPHSARLLPGCHMYPWSYSIHPPQGVNWEVDIYISGPRGKQLAANALMKGADGYTGTRYYKLCSAVAPRGTYTIVAVMNLWGSSGDQVGHLPTVHYSIY